MIRKVAFLSFVGALVALGAAGEQTIKKNFTVKPGGTLTMDVRGESIQIRTSHDGGVAVVVEDVPDRYIESLKIEQSGDNVSVVYKPARRRQEGVRFLITVPQKYNADVKYDGGGFEIEDKLDGWLTVTTGGGNVEFVEVTGRVEITSGGGNVEGKRLGGELQLKTGGGNVKMGEIGGVANVKTGGGNMRLEKVGKDLTLETGGGNVKIGNVGGKATVESGGGNLELGELSGSAEVKTGGGNLEVDGARGRTTIQSGGGNLSLSKLAGSANVRTGGGNVKADLSPEGSENSRIFSKGGDITLRVPENAKATIEVNLRVRHERDRRYTVRSDFKADKYVKEDDGEISATYILNGGGQKIEVETTNGDIEILRLR